MAEIRYVTGDATAPVGEGLRCIVHIVNDVGRWGRGFVVSLAKRWPETEKLYRAWYDFRNEPHNEMPEWEQGAVLYVQVGSGIVVANIIGQQGIRGPGNPTPVRYDSIRTGLAKVARSYGRAGASVHMPRIGCGLAGGTWDRVEAIIRDELVAHGVDVTVYDLPESRT